MVGLELFAKSIGIDIYQKFADKETLSSVFIEMGSANKKGLSKMAGHAAENVYTLVKQPRNYFLVVPISQGEKLILVPNFRVYHPPLQDFGIINFLGQMSSICQLVYTLYKNEDAPNWQLTVNRFDLEGEWIHFQQNKVSDQELYNNEKNLLNAVKTLDRQTMVFELSKLTHTQIIGELFAENNFVRGEKNALISMVVKLTQAVIDGGLPAQKAFNIENLLIQKIELKAALPTFNIWINEITYFYFQTLAEYTKNQSLKLAEKCKKYIDTNLSEKLKISDISKVLYSSKQNLSLAFKQQYQISLNQYIRIAKVEAAKILLERTEYSLDQISDYLSFTDKSYFLRTFKKYTKQTPSSYRRERGFLIVENEDRK
ncbi:helix-turn-helix domain-containing protein [Oenococcus sicerae]|uniref:Helix-turn-helix domain-containing protein n=1 Tax=Oenococcus sicerae TaxID=2203724 RepID=A0ABX5QNK2_9LACO|nr:helix-turn-helix domain-containing protein [Oenococcus sicerae]QAS70366.1 helix-turn-helix domain-containing protein [Oenococcus sicerae]